MKGKLIYQAALSMGVSVWCLRMLSEDSQYIAWEELETLNAQNLQETSLQGDHDSQLPLVLKHLEEGRKKQGSWNHCFQHTS
jgi:hypothetical protein